MSLHPRNGYPIPTETQPGARAAVPNGPWCLPIADMLGPISAEAQCMDLFPRRGPPAQAPARRALTPVLQCVEHLPDRRAADAVRGRLDWK
jgi:transposase